MKPTTVLLLLSCLVLAGCQQPADEGVAPAQAAGPPPVPTVTTVRLQHLDLVRVIEQPAQIEAYFETALIARIPGTVAKVRADIGQRLKGPVQGRRGQVIEPGEILAELWVPELVQEHNQKKGLVEQAHTELAQAEANVEVAEAQTTSAEALMREAEAGLARAQSNVDFRESEYKRFTKLAGTVLQEQIRDEAKYQFESAQASLKEVNAKVASATAQWKESQARHKKAQADVNAARARIEVAQSEEARLAALVEYATIRAPYDCVVTKRNVDPETFVQPGTGAGSMPLFVVASNAKVRLFVDVPEKDALLIKDGLTATIKVATIKDRDFQGKVTRQSWSLDPKSRTLRVEIDLPNQEELLRPGMYAYTTFRVSLPKRPTLRAAAVVLQGDNAFAWQVVNNKAVKTPLLIGYRDGNVVEVFRKQQPAPPGGAPAWVEVRPDDEFIVGDLGTLSDGQAVNIKK
jgi:multidrug efflux pump subunit AcrA (membrane-fusion protein)